ncbi:putative glucuronoxylan glucuronosyltransferase IRX7 [Acorus calamus]|uniref:Glucuronoxylan glucuronosyltransferase IRX7 n=1 Tax=Acorus calamus TaxID=4465 RepID=A0AAV9CM49_ACOCL|nr:putative glucuronoxylan glucuronosyltransferase IRX7 [Acorus calamus]
MKLLHRPIRTNIPERSLLSIKNLRWLLLLWFSLSLFFLLISLSTTTTTTNNSNFSSLRIYIYDLPSTYNSDWLSNPRCATHLFASEVAIHRALLRSPARTTDPSQADFFFVPVYVSCNFSTLNGFPALGHARGLLYSAVQRISSDMPFWNRSRGSDHVFVASHDFGACFHAMEDVAVAAGVPEFMRNSIVLQTFGVTRPHTCQNVEHVLIPPYVSPQSVRSRSDPATAGRDIFAFFRGKMEVNPKNVSGRFYSKDDNTPGRRVRTEIWRRYGNDGRFYVKRKRYDGYRSEIGRSTFCLCPLGWAPWSPRLVEAVALGCVPVIIADGIRLPFPETVRWPEISLSVSESDIGSLAHVLEHVAATNLSVIQRNLWDPAVRLALMFNEEVQCGDATWHVLVALEGKLRRRRM